MNYIEIERNEEDAGNVTILVPPCECRECSQQYYSRNAQHWRHTRYIGVQEDADAQDSLNKQVTKIRKNQEYLRGAISKHGNTIVSRWKKKSIAKRVECLVKALPAIEEHRWAIFNYHYQVPAWKSVEDTRVTYLLPYVSLEDLKSDPMRLLSLLHYRAHCQLDEWILFDTKQTKTGWDRGRLLVKYCSKTVVMHGQQYGKLVDWDEDRAHRWDTVGYPRAQLAIESQHLLYVFLHDMIADLIKGVEIESSSTKWIELSQSDFRRSSEDEKWSAFSNQAYTTPPTFNVDRLTDIALSRFAEAGDRLWLLQTDSLHAKRAITYHRSSLIGQRISSEGSAKDVNAYVAHCLTYSTVQRVQDWKYVVDECRNVGDVLRRFRDNVDTGKQLPRKYSEALSCLELLLRNVLLVRAKGLTEMIPRLRGFEQSFGRLQLDAKRGIYAIPLSNRDTKEAYEEDPMLWCLNQMTMGDENTHVATRDKPKHIMTDPAMLFGLLENLIEKAVGDSADNDRIETSLLDELSELGAVWELLTAIRYHRPVLRRIEKEEAMQIAPPRPSWRQWKGEMENGPVDRIENDHESQLIAKFDSSPMPSGKKDNDWLVRATRARRLLTEFWISVRSNQRRYFEAIQSSEEDIAMLLSLVSFDQAPEHLASVQEERDAILKPRQSVSETKQLGYTPQTIWDPSAGDVDTAEPDAEKKEKQKTRGVAAPAPEAPAPEPAPVAPPFPTVVVQETHLKIFRGMYPAAGDRPTGADIDWNKFVAAMADAGFAATQSSGSAVMFSNGHGRIIFHKPHPVAKINPVMLATFGKRMTSHYSWRRESFFPAE